MAHELAKNSMNLKTVAILPVSKDIPITTFAKRLNSVTASSGTWRTRPSPRPGHRRADCIMMVGFGNDPSVGKYKRVVLCAKARGCVQDPQGDGALGHPALPPAGGHPPPHPARVYERLCAPRTPHVREERWLHLP
ncbi:hypothetical protein CALVIDRAFT_543234 [Calocera viscosa TUFC12733]|uniref:Uncharacterized protein n=1 Tax=Calocera viscosa (strain TUFC12733) TaxID=1330018 RepID=A0A167FUP5_CALVF|nr:hypothetical protein CALVIDRAFT_543234 [Calocera viscosa TUFC12733]